jgi:hypothetical protein
LGAILEAKVVLPAIQTKHFSEIVEGVKGNEVFIGWRTLWHFLPSG